MHFFIIFKGLSMKQITQTFLEDENPTLISCNKVFVFEIRKHNMDFFYKFPLLLFIITEFTLKVH